MPSSTAPPSSTRPGCAASTARRTCGTRRTQCSTEATTSPSGGHRPRPHRCDGLLRRGIPRVGACRRAGRRRPAVCTGELAAVAATEDERPTEMVRALAGAGMNRMPIAVCDRVGVERGQDWIGGTVITDADGYPLALGRVRQAGQRHGRRRPDAVTGEEVQRIQRRSRRSAHRPLPPNSRYSTDGGGWRKGSAKARTDSGNGDARREIGRGLWGTIADRHRHHPRPRVPGDASSGSSGQPALIFNDQLSAPIGIRSASVAASSLGVLARSSATRPGNEDVGQRLEEHGLLGVRHRSNTRT